MKKYLGRVLAFALAMLMVLPLVPTSIFATGTATTYLSQDFESFAAGKTLTASDGFSAVAPINKVLAENENHFLRLPLVAQTPTSADYKTGTTNAGKFMQFQHSAIPATGSTSIKVDLRYHGVGGSNPNAGLWIRSVNYTNSSGASATENWFQLYNVNLLTGGLIFNVSCNPQTTGAAGLVAERWNAVEVVFHSADGSFDVYVNDVLYAKCSSPVTGTAFNVTANKLMYAINGTNSYTSFTATADADESYTNCNYLDADNFKIEEAVEKAILDRDFESSTSGAALTTGDGFSAVAPINKVLTENDNRFLRLPLVAQTPTSADYKAGTTNAGKWMQFRHAAIPATGSTSIKVDLRYNGVGGSSPNAGLWLRRFNYTPTGSTTVTTGQWYRLYDVNLLTGELIIESKRSPQITGATGLVAGEWNTVEVVFHSADGSVDIYVNDALYAKCVSPVTGTAFHVAENNLMFVVDGANSYTNFKAIADADGNYSNCSYLDGDNFKIEPAPPKPILEEGFERFDAGDVLTTDDGFARVPALYKVLEENGNSFVRLPIASTQTGSPDAVKVKPTNRGEYFMFKHDAFSTTEQTSVSMNLRIHGIGGKSPNVGVWIQNFAYTDVNGAFVAKHQWIHLFDVNLLTGETLTTNVNGTATGAKGLIADEWNRLEVIFDPKTGAFDVYVNDTLYKQCTSIVEGSNFIVPANTLMFAVCSSNDYTNYTAVSALDSEYSNCNYMDGDDFRVIESDRSLTGKIYYSETFDAYKAGDKLALGTTPGTTSVYAQDPFNPSNIAVKVPFGAAPNADEILMRMSGNVPVENGFYAVTRNAQTGAIEVDGWTVTPENGGKYTITDGTTTYTGLELSTKQTYYAYWGADGAIDQNWRLPIPEISYKNQTSVVLSADYYISEDAYGNILAQMRYYSLDGGANKGFLDLFTINTSQGTIAPKGGSSYGGVNKGEWNNVMLELDLIGGTGKLYLNGTYLGDGTYGANLTLIEGALSIAKMNRKYSGYKNFSGYFMVDNVKLMTSKTTVTVASDRLLYVEVGGRKIYATSFDVPEGSTYKAVYFNDDDYLGMMTTEQSNSIRLSSSSGLRFATRLDMSLVDALYELLDNKDLADVTFGTLIAPTSYISTDFTMAALDAAGKRYLEVDATRDKYFAADDLEDTTHFVGSIANFYESNIARPFSGRGYVKVTLRSGQEIVLYSAVSQSSSVMDVATRVLQDPDYVKTLSAEKKAILDTYAAGKAPAVPEDVLQNRKLDRLNVLAVGDSLFNGDFVGYENQWLALMAERHNWNMTNLGKNGWAISDTSEAPVSKRSIYNYLMNDPDNFRYGTTSTSYYNTGKAQQLTANDVELIFLEGGNNDQGAQVPFGTIDSTDPKTLLGGIRTVTDHLLNTYPNAKLVLITSWHFDSTTTATDGRSLSHMKYAVESMKMLYNAYYVNNPRVSLIDAGDPNISGVDMSDATWRGQYAKDKYHLNEEGMKIMANSMEEILPEALFVCDRKEGVSLKHAYENGVCKDCQSVDPLSVKEEGITRVVCVGDSITVNGYWKNNMMGYLDESFEVLGFGVSGSTGLASGIDVGYPKAYVHQDNHQLALRHNADAVVIMLGTNDSKPCNFASIQADNGVQYIKDMTAMVKQYQAACPDAQIFIGLPPTVYNDAGKFEGISEENVTSLIIPCLEEVAAATGATVVDTHTATANAKDHFTDGVHPSDDVARGMIAQAMADAILDWKN